MGGHRRVQPLVRIRHHVTFLRLSRRLTHPHLSSPAGEPPARKRFTKQSEQIVAPTIAIFSAFHLKSII
jgi:hypothetical protein